MDSTKPIAGACSPPPTSDHNTKEEVKREPTTDASPISTIDTPSEVSRSKTNTPQQQQQQQHEGGTENTASRTSSLSQSVSVDGSQHPLPPPLSTVPNAPPFMVQQPQQNGQPCYCLMPVPSGLPHVPYVYQCIPVSSQIQGTMPVVPGYPGQIPPIPLVTPPPSVTPDAGTVSSSSANQGIDSIATMLTQMKSSQIDDERHRLIQQQRSQQQQRSSDARISKNKSQAHHCNMQDTWGNCCKRTFTRPYDLLRHQETVHGSGCKSYCCKMCGCKSKKFSRQDSLARHMRRMHNLDPAETRQLMPSENETDVSEARFTDATQSVNASPESSAPIPNEDASSETKVSVPESTNKEIQLEPLLKAQMV